MKSIVLALVCVLGVTGAACRKAPAPAKESSTPATPASSPAAAPGTPGAAASTPASSSPSQAQAPNQPAAPEPAKPVPVQLPDVVAKVNDENVKKADFERLLRTVELNNGPVPQDRRNEILRRVLDDLISYTLLKQEAKARNVTVTDAEVDEQMKTIRQKAPNEAAFKKALAESGITVDRLRADTRAQMTIAKLMNDEVAGLQPTSDAEVREFYDKNPDRFKSPEAARASHILVRVDDKADDATKKAARAKIDAILQRAKNGEDFATLARENSDDGSAKQGGDLNYFPRGQMVPPFDKAVFALKPGEISEVVTTQFGYHVIKLTDLKAAGTVPLEQVSDRVKQFLTAQKKQQQAEAFLAQLKQKSKIEVLI
jgi:peptidyl-prolyl cis-trans isomerase C